VSDHLRALDAALARLQLLHPKKIDLSLGRLERLCAALGHPERKLPPVIHVAGTNGKGSTAAFVRAIVEAAGLRAHVYTSPHLVRFAERIRLAGSLISDDALADVLAEVERVNAGEAITFFEITAAAAFHAFAGHPADVAIIEVGLGGRFDATNIVPCPRVAVIAPVDYDHKEFLGDDLAGIAREKAGILKPGGRAVVARQADKAREAIAREADAVGAQLSWMGQDFDCHAQSGEVVWQDQARLLDLPIPALPGAHQIDNAGLAIAAALTFGDPRIDEASIAAGMRSVSWPARLQRLTAGPLSELAVSTGSDLWLDGGHNPHAARALAEHLKAMRARDGRPVTVIMGLLGTKDAAGVLAPFRELGARMVFTGFDAAAAMPPEGLAAAAAELGMAAETARDVTQAMQMATSTGAMSSHILICGSLYLAGEALALSEQTWPH
jgi:dihydrofolate synthase/folylpolyglutamate synthase